MIGLRKLASPPGVFFGALRRFATTGDFKECKIAVGDVQINYVKAGEGPFNLLLTPGALGSAWTDFEPQLRGLRKDLFTIVAWDPPGYGKSIPPRREYPVDFFEKDAHTAFLLMRELNIPKYSLLGWSDGGITSIIMAAKYPKQVTNAVIWGANAQILKSEIKLYDDLRDLSKWSKKMKDSLFALYGEQYFTETWNKWCDGMTNIYNTNRGNICLEMLQSIKCPTFIVHGEKDQMIHPQHVSILKANIEKAQLHVYPEGKHNIHLKYAEDFNRRVTAFLAPHTVN